MSNRPVDNEGIVTEQVYSVHVPVPDATVRELRRWSKQAEGASWPSFGGHITLIPGFRSAFTEKRILEAVQRVCRGTAPFTVRMNKVIAEPDITRSPYYAVFLTTGSDRQNGYGELAHLRSQLLQEFSPVSDFLYPELVQRPFLPHISVALSVAESEARHLAQDLRADGISVSLEVSWLEVLARDATAPRHEWKVRRRVFLQDELDGTVSRDEIFQL